MTTLAEKLIGSWRLLSREDRTAQGEVKSEPMMGSDPLALLIYDRGGNFAAQFMKRDRSQPVLTHQMSGAGNNSVSVGGYDAYFGKYTVDEASQSVTQTLLAAIAPGDVGKVVTRRMLVEGSSLTIRLHTNAADGTPVERTLRWERAG